MDVDRDRLRRKSGISRGTSRYVSSGTVFSTLPPQTPPHPIEEIVQPAIIETQTLQATEQSVNLDQEDWLSSWANEENHTFFDQQLSDNDTVAIQNLPKQIQRKGKKRHPRLRKLFFRGSTVLALFALSIGAGAWTANNDQNSHKSSLPAVASAVTENATSGTTGLSVSQTLGSSQVGQASSSLLQTTTSSTNATQSKGTYLGSKVIITTQNLPDNFIADPEQALANFAANLKATEKIDTMTKGTAYALTDKTTQVIAFITSSKLVIIQSMGVHTAADWQTYIDDLTV